MQKDSVHLADGRPESAVASHEYTANGLLRCPHCEGSAYQESTCPEDHWIECEECHAQGPLGMTPAESIEKWNRRASHAAVPAETSADTSVWDANKRAAFEKWATEYERLSMFGPSSFNNKITWAAYRAGVAYQASSNKDTAILAAYRTLIHTHHPAPDGSEFGFCRVRFDARGQVESCLWAGHDEVDAAVAAIVEAESGISPASMKAK